MKNKKYFESKRKINITYLCYANKTVGINSEICTMNILIVFPTEIEAKNFIPQKSEHCIRILVSGVAVYNTLYNLTQYCSNNNPDLIIHGGIAGTFTNSYSYGDVVCVIEDCFADVGVLEHATFKNLFDLELAHEHTFPFTNGFIHSSTKYCSSEIPQVRGITVHEITSTDERKNILEQKYNPDIESMEGAAVHFVCAHQNIPYVHLRAISNKVGDRNKNNWHVSEAIQSLHHAIFTTIKLLSI